MAMAGPPQSLNSNTAVIDELLAEWNAQAGGISSESAAGSATGGATPDEGGCGCVSGGQGGLASLALVGLVGLVGRRRRR